MPSALRQTLSSLFLLAVGTSVACGSNVAEARRPYVDTPHHAPYYQRDIEVVVESPNGGSFQSHWYQGGLYVAGERGERYAIRVTNHTGERIEAVITVDGRDVISGDVGDFRKHRGYVIEPYGSVVVDGFRRSLDQVAAFRFGGIENSYSTLRGTPQHVGVIGVAAFKERERQTRHHGKPIAPHPYYEPYRDADGRSRSEGGPPPASTPPSGGARDEAPAPFPDAPAKKQGSAERGGASESRSPRPANGYDDGRGGGGDYAPEPARRNELGTEYGETRWSSVREVEFKRENRRRPDWTLTVYYDSREGLRNRGVPLDPPPPYPTYAPEPEPFPDSSFAPPPPRRY